MNALVVYESMWGNTEQVAEAIAVGLRQSMEVELCEVRQAPADPGPEVGLIVAGGPTHAFSMSRATTRSDAVNQGADRGSSDRGLREWLDALPTGSHPQQLATFDTKVSRRAALTGIGRQGRRQGGPPARVRPRRLRRELLRQGHRRAAARRRTGPGHRVGKADRCHSRLARALTRPHPAKDSASHRRRLETIPVTRRGPSSRSARATPMCWRPVGARTSSTDFSKST